MSLREVRSSTLARLGSTLALAPVLLGAACAPASTPRAEAPARRSVQSSARASGSPRASAEALPATPPAPEVNAAVLQQAAVVLREGGGTERPGVPAQPWDHRTAPAGLDRIVSQIGLTANERRLLERNGFVVLGRAAFGNWGYALHEIHRRELPLWVSADAVAHALFRSHESLQRALEGRAAVDLAQAISTLVAGLPAARSRYSPELAADLEWYLSVASELGSGSAQWDLDGLAAKTDPVSRTLHAVYAAQGKSEIDVLGRRRVVDWSRFKARGYYADSSLAAYFRQSTWLSRFELNLVSRSTQSSAPAVDPRPTPRETALALGLADLAARTGALELLVSTEAVWRALAGPTEVVSMPTLARLAANADLRDAEALQRGVTRAVGEGFERTVSFQVNPYGTGRLPVIAAPLGVGITPDSRILPTLMDSGQPSTRIVRGLDLAYVLGAAGSDRHLRASHAFRRDLHPAARAALSLRGDDLYAHWLRALAALAQAPSGTVPTFADGPAFADARVASTLVGYGQLRHAYVLYGVDVYDHPGCQVPDAWLEPALPFYDAMATYLDRAEAVIGGSNALVDADYFARARSVLGALRAIARDELSGRALSPAQRTFLAMVSEYEPPGAYESSGPGKLDGWYPALFPETDYAFRRASFVSDVATSATQNKITYLGATQPRLGVFVVDVGGAPRALVGPVARAFERIERGDVRLDDASVRDDAPPPAVWERSYLAPAGLRPQISYDYGSTVELTWSEVAPAGRVTVQRLDAHGDALTSVSSAIGAGVRRVTLDVPEGEGELRVITPDGAAWEPALTRFYDTFDRGALP